MTINNYLRNILGFAIIPVTGSRGCPRNRDIKWLNSWPTTKHPRTFGALGTPRALWRRLRKSDAAAGRPWRRRRRGWNNRLRRWWRSRQRYRRRWIRSFVAASRWCGVPGAYTCVWVLLWTWSPSVFPIAFAGA